MKVHPPPHHHGHRPRVTPQQTMGSAQQWPSVDIVHLGWTDEHGHVHHVHKLKTLQAARASEDGKLYFRAGAQIDVDGSGPHHGDPDAQDQTSLQCADKSYLNADTTPFFVLPPQVAERMQVSLGDCALIRNAVTGQSVAALFGDYGPHEKIGEISRYAAQQLGVDPSPTTGGTDQDIQYLVLPHSAAFDVNHGQLPTPAQLTPDAIQARFWSQLGRTSPC